MKTVLRLIIVVFILFSIIAFSACAFNWFGQTEDDGIVSSDNDGNEQEEEPQGNKNKDTDPSTSPDSEIEGTDSIHTTPTIKPTEQAYNSAIEVGREDTVGLGIPVSDLDQFNLNQRLLGLMDDSNPHGIEDYTNGIVATRNAFVLNNRFIDEIIAGIALDDSFYDIRKAIGQPGWETDSILLYRSLNYYLLFQGNQKAQYAVIIKAPDTQYDKNILSTIIGELNGKGYTSLEESLSKVDLEGTFFEDNGFINGGGYYASSIRGINILDFDEKYIEIYNNYQGSLFDHTDTNPRYDVRFIDRDMVIDIMLNDFNRYLEIEELFDNEGVKSPDGKLNAVFEWIYSMEQHFIVRTLDNSIQDRYIYASTLSDFQWLTNNHLVYIDSYNEVPYAIDVNFSDPSSMNILFEAGIIKDRDVDLGKYKFEIIDIKDHVIRIKDTLINKTYNIQYAEDKNGIITFKPE